MTDATHISRRGVVVGAGVAAGALTIAACGGPDVSYSASSKSTTSAASSTTTQTTTDAPTTTEAPAVPALAQTSDVPTGGAVIVDGVLLTQETPGDIRAFSPTCTHRGCTVQSLGGTIVCPCHGSAFNLDGTVAAGPASRSLNPVEINVSGGKITLA